MQHTPDALAGGLFLKDTAARNAFASIVSEPGEGD
jgi:hypothetical protein